MDASVIARFTFQPDRAHEFSEGGHQVVEMALESVYEIREYTEEFKEALIDVSAIVDGKVLHLSDFASFN